MHSRSREYFLFFLVISGLSTIWGAGAAEHGGGGGGEEKAEASAAGKPAPSKKEAIEYSKKAARINSLKGRIDEAEKNFAELLHRKEQTHDPQEKQHLAEEMAKLDKEKKTAAKELEELSQELKYRFPNEGKDIDRHFSHDKSEKRNSHADEPDEKKSELDEKLTHVAKKVEKKYAPLMPKPTAVEDAAQARAEGQGLSAKPPKEVKKRLQLVK